MSCARVLIAGWLAGLLILPLSAAVGPDPEPPFLVKKGIRTLPELKTGTILWKRKSYDIIYRMILLFFGNNRYHPGIGEI